MVTSSKVTQNTQPIKTSLAGQPKKVPEKGKAKPTDKRKKNPATMPNTTSGPSSNLHSQLKDKAKHTAALIQEITENYKLRRGIHKRGTGFKCYPIERPRARGQ